MIVESGSSLALAHKISRRPRPGAISTGWFGHSATSSWPANSAAEAAASIIAQKVYLNRRCATVTDLLVRLYNVSQSFREAQMAIFTHDAENERPGESIWASGRFNDTSSEGAWINKVFNSLSLDLSAYDVVWVVCGYETGSSRVGYGPGSDDAPSVWIVPNNSSAQDWLNGLAVGADWADLTNISSAVSYNTRLYCMALVGSVQAAPVPPEPEPPPASSNQATHNGITWTFSDAVTTGTFVDGSPYVVSASDVSIIDISPKSIVSDGRTLHGTMVNPTAGHSANQGFDSQCDRYLASLNVGRPSGNYISEANPLVVSAGSSVLSAKSLLTTEAWVKLESVGVLTVLASAPAANSFRPPYCGTSKTILATESDLNYSALPSLAPVTGTPALATLNTGMGTGPWIEVTTNYQGRKLHPRLNQPNYGANMAHAANDAMVRLCLNDSDADKRDLLVKVVQLGIDLYGAAMSGGRWNNDGGNNPGRKAPVVFAAKVLGNGTMLGYCNGTTYKWWQEDQQTFYVSQTEVDLTNSAAWEPDTRGGTETYGVEDIGTPEWGIQHTNRPEMDNASWTAYYRNVACPCTVGAALTAHLIEADGDWNWPAFFDYYDRFEANFTSTGSGQNNVHTFIRNMWAAYR